MIPLALHNGAIIRMDGRPVVKARHTLPQTPLTADDAPHIESYRSLIDAPCQAPALQGDGVVYSMYEANGRADVGTTISIRLLRESGWDGAVQLWHAGHVPGGLESLGVDCRRFGEQPGNWQGWAAKSYALRYSGLAKALVIDWDAYCVVNPRPLFDRLDDYAMLYWCGSGPNTDGVWRYNPAIFSQFTDEPVTVGAIQGGFMLFNCRDFWRGIVLQRQYDDNAEWWYPRNRGVDEEGWRLSLSILKPRALWCKPLDWSDPAWINRVGNDAYAVHRIGKLWPDRVPKWNRGLPMEEKVQALYRDLVPGYRRMAIMEPGPGCQRPKAFRPNRRLQRRLQLARQGAREGL